MSSLLIIGGSDAGISAALRAREVDPAARVTIVLADAFPNYSICGLPFFLSGETPDWKQLAHRTEFPGIEPLTEHRATRIDPDTRTVQVAHRGRERRLAYERLVVGAGTVPVRPPIDGLDQPGVYLLHTMEDSFRVHEHLTQRVAPRRAVIIGAGYIGLEMADALTHRGLTVTVASRPAEVLTTVDPELGRHVRAELVRRGVEVRTGVEVRSIERAGSSGELSVRGPGGFEAAADLALVAVGVRPDSELARSAGVETDRRGAIRVNRAMETNVANIYAAGDCVETWHRLLEKTTYLPLGTTSRKQGRVAGENAVGGRAWFAGSVGTQVVKIFELAIARTGLLHAEALAAGFEPLTVESTCWDHKAYYPGARELRVRVTADRASGRLLGAQLLGHWKAEVSKRVDIFATALFHGMRVEELNHLDLSYTPPLSSPRGPEEWGGCFPLHTAPRPACAPRGEGAGCAPCRRGSAGDGVWGP